MSTLDKDAINTALAELSGWEHQDDRLRRSFSFEDFQAAIAFINRVAALAEAANHHPELHNVYADVTIELTSHDAGGVTDRDVALARAISDAV